MAHFAKIQRRSHFREKPMCGFRVFSSKDDDFLDNSDISPPSVFRVTWCLPLDLSVSSGLWGIFVFDRCVQNARCAKDRGSEEFPGQ